MARVDTKLSTRVGGKTRLLGKSKRQAIQARGSRISFEHHHPHFHRNRLKDRLKVNVSQS
ncbi:hypothetical protein M7I_6451 [Glarea lozoyensis 74030]|uniref:Uncharacterized protein n=1 Tax=Glarea lozoyensis (strain ATCC 74030 / MF5533) TaxID=1104152 RepID=H0EUL4_GLAL7|nr:hypothetical protein M7I_6451 [Glarea lozoyensis 74030]